jgi:hypothetical protein
MWSSFGFPLHANSGIVAGKNTHYAKQIPLASGRRGMNRNRSNPRVDVWLHKSGRNRELKTVRSSAQD